MMMQRENVPKKRSCQGDYSECSNGERISHIGIRKCSRLNMLVSWNLPQEGQRNSSLLKETSLLKNVTTKCSAWSLNEFWLGKKKTYKGIIEQLEKYENGLHIP